MFWKYLYESGYIFGCNLQFAKNKDNYMKLLSGSTLTVTLEPCSTFGKTPPCLDEILKYNFKKVIIGAVDPSQSSIKKLEAAGIEVEIEKILIIRTTRKQF